MNIPTDLSDGRSDLPDIRAAEKLFARVQAFAERAAHDLPARRALIERIDAAGRAGRTRAFA